MRQAVGRAGRAARDFTPSTRGLNKGGRATMIEQLAVDGPVGGGRASTRRPTAPTAWPWTPAGLPSGTKNNFTRALDEISRTPAPTT
jgi:hypothetical protein